MGQLLDKKIVFLFLFILSFVGVNAQQDEKIYRPKDYKDREQFEKFRKRRMIIGAWQINELKQGALVVRLKTNQKLIEALKQQGNVELAAQKSLEQQAINLNTIRAYVYNYTFSKIYFIYSNSSDSLLRGARSNIFLDTNLKVDPKIVMSEKFYLLAERDYVYNSSIGFVPEDSARVQIEQGNSVKEVPIVIKNKYGHQLKGPFPYYVGEKFDQQKKLGYLVYISINGIMIPFNIGGSSTSRDQKSYNYNGIELKLNIPKNFTYQKLAVSVERMNDYLIQFHQSAPAPDLSRIDPGVLPFLY
jgi:hypothetical protein